MLRIVFSVQHLNRIGSLQKKKFNAIWKFRRNYIYIILNIY